LDLGSLARSYTEECLKQVSAVLSNDPDTARRLTAAQILLDRGYGRPKQETTNEVKGELRILMRKVFDDGEENP